MVFRKVRSQMPRLREGHVSEKGRWVVLDKLVRQSGVVMQGGLEFNDANCTEDSDVSDCGHGRAGAEPFHELRLNVLYSALPVVLL